MLAESLMHPMVPLYDGLDVYFFDDTPGFTFLALDDAMRWVEREMAGGGMTEEYRVKYGRAVDAMRDFRDGKTEEHPTGGGE